jgi:WD40 repeat protein/serine/threonine protein kinase
MQEFQTAPPMNPEFDRIQQTFLEVSAIAEPAARQSYLDNACKGNPELRRQVEALLFSHENAGEFLKRSVVPSPAGSLTEAPGTVVGKYKLLQEIGEGGFGVVFMAEQLEPVQRKVALKVIKPGMDTREVIARFEAERQALALMDHPNVARVLDGGTTMSGRPYFVMDLVKGTPITDFCDQNKLSPKDRLNLFLQVCAGVQHAHQKGIIHRDLKPTNVLVTLQDALPLAKVIDFGIAKAIGQKLTEKTLFTRFEQLLGTPAYMSPEQAEWSGTDVDTRSDIYSLGVVLYELLTGTTPFEKDTLARAALDEVRRMIRETEPPTPSMRLQGLGQRLDEVARRRRLDPPLLARAVRGDLDWIVMKSLDKDRARRYETANALARDVERHLNGELVTARPPSVAYRAGKFILRNRTAVTATAFGVAALALLVLGSFLWQARQTREARRLAAEIQQQATRYQVLAAENLNLAQQAQTNAEESHRSELNARENLYAADISQIQHALAADNLRQARELLQKQIPKSGEPDLRGFEWRYLWRQCQSDELFGLPGHEEKAFWLAFLPDGKSLATAGGVGGATIKICDLATGRAITTVSTSTDDVFCVSFSPNGRILTTTSRTAVHLWDTKTFQKLRSFRENAIRAVFSPKGDYFVTASTNCLILRDTTSWSALKKLQSSTLIGNEDPHFSQLTFSPDGTSIALTTDEGVKFYSVPDLQEIRVLKDRLPRVRFLAFSPDAHTLATCTKPDRTAKLWNIAEQRELHSLVGHSDCIVGASFSPDGRKVATACCDQTIKLWDVTTGELLRTYKGHAQEVWGVAFSPDGNLLASVGKDGSVKVWDASTKFDRLSDLADVRPQGFDSEGNLVGFRTNSTLTTLDPESLELVSTEQFVGRDRRAIWREKRLFTYRSLPFANLFCDGCTAAFEMKQLESGSTKAEWLELWDLNRREFLCALQNQGGPVSYAPARRLLATCTSNQTVSLSQMAGGAPVAVITNAMIPADFSPDGTKLALIPAGFSPDGTMLATFNGLAYAIDLWKTTARQVQHLFKVDSDTPRAEFSPDSRMLAVAGDDSVIRVYTIPAGRLLVSLIGHKRSNLRLSFSADGRTLASAGYDGTVRLWHLTSGRELMRFQMPVEDIHAHDLLFSPDGRSLLAWRDDPHGGLTRLWSAPSFAEIAVAEGQEYRSLAHDAATWHAVGKALVKRDRLEEAVNAFSETVQQSAGKDGLESLRASALRQRSQVFRRLGRLNEAGPDNCAALNIPARDVRTPLTCIDLSAYYNGSLDRDWFSHSIPFYDPFPTLPRGRQTLCGTNEFDLRGVVQLSMDGAPPGFPGVVDGIAVRQKCRRLHFLQAAYHGESQGTQIGAYVIHFAGGGREEIPIRYGEEVRDWVPVAGESQVGKIAWTGRNSTSSTIRLFHDEWENSRPELEIESFDFVSKQTKSAPFLVAVTTE